MEKRDIYGTVKTDKSPHTFTSPWLTWGEKTTKTGRCTPDKTDKRPPDPASVSFVSASTARLPPNAPRGTIPCHEAESTPVPGQLAPDDAPGARHRWSPILQDDFWGCDTDAQAQTLRAEGIPAYAPKELRLLRRLKAQAPDVAPVKLQAIHTIKQVFGAMLDAVEQVAPPPGGAGPQMQPGVCYACGTRRRWRSLSGVLICGTCHSPADAALVAGWESQEEMNHKETRYDA